MNDRLPVLDYATPKPATRRFTVWPPLSRVVLEALFISFVAVVIKGFDTAIYYQYSDVQLVYIAVWLPATLVILAQYLVPSMRVAAERSVKDRRVWKCAAIISIAMLLFNVRYDKCPHATYWQFGPITWVNGNACKNRRNFQSVFFVLIERIFN